MCGTLFKLQFSFSILYGYVLTQPTQLNLALHAVADISDGNVMDVTAQLLPSFNLVFQSSTESKDQQPRSPWSGPLLLTNLFLSLPVIVTVPYLPTIIIESLVLPAPLAPAPLELAPAPLAAAPLAAAPLAPAPLELD